MKLKFLADNVDMSRSVYAIIALFLLVPIVAHTFNGSTWRSQEVAIYQNADPLHYGIATDVEQLHLRDLYQFGLGAAMGVPNQQDEGFLTATLVEQNVAQALDALFKEVSSAPASQYALKFEGYYNAITLGEHELYRITRQYHYNEFDHQITSRLLKVHYLYNNKETGIRIEFGLEPAPLDMLLNISKNKTLENIAQKEALLQAYQQNYVLRIYRANALSLEQGIDMNDIMFAATLLGATEQPWVGIPNGNNYLSYVIESLRKHPQMAVYLNLQQG